MNINKKKKIIILAVLVVIIMIVSIFLNIKNKNRSEISNNGEKDFEDNEQLIYSFDDMLDLEENGVMDDRAVSDSGMPDFGILSDYYDGVDVEYYEDKMRIETNDGYMTISKSWMDEGYAKYIKEPEFGILDKFYLKAYSITADYKDVKMKEVTKYIEQLSELGFNNVILNNKQEKLYCYSAENGEGIVVTLNYENESLILEVYNK